MPDQLVQDLDITEVAYTKLQIDQQRVDDDAARDALLNGKVNTQTLGSPIGTARLDANGKHYPAETPFSDITEIDDVDNETTVVNPKRLHYIIEKNTVSSDSVGAPNGVAPLDSNALVPQINLPPAQIVKTYVVDLFQDLLDIAAIVHEGDRGIVTADPITDNNGEWVAEIDNPALAENWSLLPNLSAVQSVNGATGHVVITSIDESAANAADIIVLDVAVGAVDDRVTSTKTFLNKTGIDVDNIIDLGEHAVTDNLPNNADGTPYVEGIITVYGDHRTVSNGNGLVQLFWNGAIVVGGRLDGAYIARSTTDLGATWSLWEVEPIYTDADYFDYTPQVSPLTHKEGRFFYDDTSKTHLGYTDIVGVSRNYGEQFDFRTHNITGTQALNGRAVKGTNGATGGYMNIEYADTTSFVNARVTGVLTNTMDNGSDGYTTVIGSVGVDTTDVTLFTWTPAVGDSIFLNAAGTYSPVRDDIFSYVGLITSIGVDGSMLVKPTTVIDDPKVGAFMDVINTQTLAITAVQQQVGNYDTDSNYGMTTDTVVGSITCPYDGSHEFSLNMYGTADTNNRILYVEIFDATNTTVITSQVLATNLGTSNTGSKSFVYKTEALANTLYVVRLYSDNSYTFNLQKLQFSMASDKITTGF